MSTNQYSRVDIRCNPTERDILIAFLSQYPFESFVEQEFGLEAYIGSEHISKKWMEEWCHAIPVDFSFEIMEVKNENWNQKWEADFEPVDIDNFCRIRADFHLKNHKVRYDLIINPKMAFGTAHHETTYMMIQQLETTECDDAKVLDYGCGTGILAILTEKMGASNITAIDYDINSYENTLENLEINKCTKIKAIHGTIDEVDESDFDIILANINRQVLLDSARQLYDLLKRPGEILISGLLREDLELVKDRYTTLGFSQKDIVQKGEWICIRYAKK